LVGSGEIIIYLIIKRNICFIFFLNEEVIFMRICGVYKIECKITGRKYIGSSVDVNKRLKEHIRKLNKGTNSAKFLQAEFLKYGEEHFTFELLEEVETDKLGEMERFLIVNLNTVYPNGFNSSLGGETGRRGTKVSEEERRAISIRVSGENNPNYGNRWSDERREEMSINRKGFNKGVPKSEEHKKKMSESGKGKHNHHGMNNPKCRIDEQLFLQIKEDMINLYSLGYYKYQIEDILAEKYQFGSITIRRVMYGKHYLTEKLGCLADWTNNNTNNGGVDK
jgi:group I intron endonuclease